MVKINGENVFDLGHEQAKDLIRRAGNKLNLVVERGDKIVPSMNSAFPKAKSEEEVDSKPKTYSQMVKIIFKFVIIAHFSQNLLLTYSPLPAPKDLD